MKNIKLKHLSIAAVALLGMFACQQNDWIDGEITQRHENRLSSRSTSCDITLSKAGTLDSMLNIKAKEENFTREELTSLTITGPIFKEDIDCIREYKKLKTLDVTKCKFMAVNDYILDAKEMHDLYDVGGIPESMFASMSCAEIFLPDTIQQIGGKAFQNSAITSINIPNSVSYLGGDVFMGCSNLSSVKLSNLLTEIPSGAFYMCGALAQIELHSGIVEIGSWAFERTGLTEITIPETIKVVGEGACQGCTALEHVNWPVTLDAIGDGTFAGCSSLQFSIPQHVKHIGNSAFYGCQNMTGDLVLENVETIGREAFGRTGITSISLSDNAVVEGDNLLRECKELQSVKLPSNLRSIGEYMFYGCEKLKEIIIPNTAKSIGDGAFYDCSSLQEILLPEGLEQIGEGAFSGTAIKTLTVPSTVTQCGAYIVGGSSSIAAVVWNASIAVPALTTYQDVNLLLYVSGNTVVEASNQNVIRDSHASCIVLNDYRSFYCPQPFTTDSIAYVRFFDGYETIPGESNGWQTLVLPFTVTYIAQQSLSDPEKILAPFNADVEGAKPFWLYELTADGFTNATQIEANKPYLIAMPNYSNYLDEYNILGSVLFAASGNVEVPATPTMQPVVGPEYSLCPTYAIVPQSDAVWMLNAENYVSSATGHEYKPGSVFLPNKRDVKPFEAYVTSNSTRSFLPITRAIKQTRSNHVVGPIPSIDDM